MLVLVAVPAAALTPFFDGMLGGDSQSLDASSTPGASEISAARWADSEDGSTESTPSSPTAPLLNAFLGESVTEPLADRDPVALMKAFSKTEGPGDPGLVEILRLASETYESQPASYPPAPDHDTLQGALDGLARVQATQTLSRQERAAVERLPPAIAEPLADLVDAYAYASRMQQFATRELSDVEQAELRELSGGIAAADASDPPSPEKRDRYRELSSQVDMGAMTHGALELTETTLDVKTRLQAAVNAGALEDLPTDAAGSSSSPKDFTHETISNANHATQVRWAAQLLRDGQTALDHTPAPPAPAGPEPPLSEALDLYLSRLTPHDEPVPRLDADVGESMPADLEAALSRLVLAYADTAPSSPSTDASNENAARMLETAAQALPTLKKWSHILEETPYAARGLTPQQTHARTLDLALTAPTHARTLSGALSVAAAQSSLDVPDGEPHLDPPPLGKAMDAWYATFDLPAPPRGDPGFEASLDALPDDARRALAVLLHAQVRADEILENTDLTPDQVQTLTETSRSLHAIHEGNPATPERAHDLERYQEIVDDPRRAVGEATQLLAYATDVAGRYLGAGVGDPSSAAPDNQQPEPPQTEFSDPASDVWFKGPTGRILVTGFEGTTQEDGYHAVFLDLGGDDVHEHNAGGALDTKDVPFAVSLDAGGDDVYRTDDPYRQGAAARLTNQDTLPVGLLVDQGGDDVYEGGPFSQGATYQGGVALLQDEEGSDRYTVSGELERQPADYPIAGGQGYAFRAPASSDRLRPPPSTAMLVDLNGTDRYDSPIGMGSALSVNPPSGGRPVEIEGDDTGGFASLSLGGLYYPRASTGMFLDVDGRDAYTCEGDVCLGKGEKATTETTDCEADEECGSGLRATGTFVDLSGHDDYRGLRGANNRILDPSPNWQNRSTGSINATVFVDLGLGDANDDGIPDHLAEWLGYEPDNEQDSPSEDPIEAINPQDLLLGPDSDGDGYTDAMEQRFGTDPGDDGSAPLATGGSSGKLVDISLDLSTGTIVTQDRHTDVQVENQLEDSEPLFNGSATEETVVGILALGDTGPTGWETDYLLSLDLGGNDTYENNAGASSFPFDGIEGRAEGEDTTRRLDRAWPGVHVDLGGGDTYQSSDSVAQGAAVGQKTQGSGEVGSPYGLLIDTEGDDGYEAGDIAQGGAVFDGTGGLLDLGGNDRYEASDVAQGSADPTCDAFSQHFPRRAPSECEDSSANSQALLLDARGDDKYTGPGQGILSTGSTSQAWFLDLAGDDAYRLHVPEEADPVTSQGYVRESPGASNFAAFLDTAGDDTYKHISRGTAGQINTTTYDKDNRVFDPADPEGDRESSLFLDSGPHNQQTLIYPDLVESFANARSKPGNDEAGGSMFAPSPGRPFVLTLPRLGIQVGGTGDNRYEQAVPFLVDLGGDDWYYNVGGSGALALDLGGDDEYNHTETLAEGDGFGDTFGAANTAIGLLVDDGGDNTFNTTLVGTHQDVDSLTGLTQGAAINGLGLLVSLDGTNEFRTSVRTEGIPPDVEQPEISGLAQGAGQGGVGFLYSGSEIGNDVYTLRSSGNGQGFGTTRLSPPIGNTGRSPLAIGIGALVDSGGSNVFQSSGANAQGSGINGVGLLASLGDGMDLYSSTREAQGLGASDPPGTLSYDRVPIPGSGLLLDEAGDDTYRAIPPSGSDAIPASQGVADGIATGMLLDYAGDDTYEAGSNADDVSASQAVATTLPDPDDNSDGAAGIAVLADLDGQDNYTAGSHSQGFAAGLSLGGASTSLLFDQRGDDAYSAQAPAQGFAGVASVSGEVPGTPAIFVDAAGADRYDPFVRNDAAEPLDIAEEAERSRSGGHNDKVWTQSPGDGGDENEDEDQDNDDPTDPELPELDCDPTNTEDLVAVLNVAQPQMNCVGRLVYGECWDDTGASDDWWGASLSADGWARSCDPRMPSIGLPIDPSQIEREAGFGVDAPTLDLALDGFRTVRENDTTGATRTGPRVTGLTCETRDAGDCDDVSGKAFLHATIQGEGHSEIDWIHFVAFSGSTDPARVAILEPAEIVDGEGGNTYTVEWNTSDPRFPNGDTIVRMRAGFSPQASSEAGRESVTNGTYVVQDELGDDPDEDIHLDNDPVAKVTFDGPDWIDPESTTQVSFDLSVLGEEPDENDPPMLISANLTHQGKDRRCGTEISRISLEDDPTTLTVGSLDSTCPTGRYNVSANISLPKLKSIVPPSSTIGIDSTPPKVTNIQVPNPVNKTIAQGGFPVSWQTHDPGIGVDRVKLEVNLGGDWFSPAGGLPANGSFVWDTVFDGAEIDFRVTPTDALNNTNPDEAAQTSTNVDLSPPTLDDPTVTPQYVQSGDPVAFTVNASDDSGIREALVDVRGAPESPYRLGSGGQATHRYDDWHEVTEDLVDEIGLDATRRQGYPFQFVVTDGAGNTAQTIEQQVFIDDVPPVVEGLEFVYPNGGAAGPGDLVRVQLDASDNLQLSERVFADTSNVSTTGRFQMQTDPASGNLTGAFLVDRADDGPASTNVTFTVEDAAGNQVTLVEPVHVVSEAPRVTGIRVTNRTTDSATLRWTSSIPSTGTVELTDSRRAKRFTFGTDELDTHHQMNLTGLDPATQYEAELVPANAAGGTGAPRPFTVTTGTAINATIHGPLSGALAAGELPVSLTASDPTEETLTASLTLSSQDTENAIEVPLTQFALPQNERTERSVDVSSAPDGLYQLLVTVSRGNDQRTRTVENVTVDNTAPGVRLTWPAPGSSAAPGNATLRAVANDVLTGVDPDTVVFTVDDRTVPATPAGEDIYTASVEIPETDAVEMGVRARDQAGNVGEDQGPVFVDGTRPDGWTARLDLPGDQTAVKPGDEVTVIAQGPKDAAGDDVEVTLPASSMLDDPVEIEPGATGHRGTFEVPEDADERLHTLEVQVRDAAGNRQRLPVSLTVDASEPAITSSRVRSVAPTSALVKVCATEDTRLHLDARAPEVPTLTAEETQPARCHRVELTGARPSTTYDATVEVVDAAGHGASTELSIVTAEDGSAPEAVPGPVTVEALDRAVRLSWTPAEDDVGLQGYHVLRNASGEGTTEIVGLASGASFVDRNLTPGQTYQYRLQPVDLAGNTAPPSEPATAQTVAKPELFEGSVTPTRGHAATVFNFTVDYVGPVDPAPEVTLVLDGTPHEMEPIGDLEDCLRGCTFAYTTRLSPNSLDSGFYEFHFEASGGTFTTDHPTGPSELSGPVVTAQTQTAGLSTLQLGLLGGLGVAGLAAGLFVALRRWGGALQ